MKVIKCPKCGFISPIEKPSRCKRCSNELESVNTARQRTLKILNIFFGIILSLLVVGITGYFINNYVSSQQEKAKRELENKSYETFNEISFKADSDSINNALKLLPPQYNSPQPPDLNLVKGNVAGSISGEETTKPVDSSSQRITRIVKKTEYRCVPSEYVGSIGGATMGNRGCGNYVTGAVSEEIPQWDSNPVVNTVTTNSVLEIKPIQYDYVRGFENKLACFVTYQANIGIFERSQRQKEVEINPIYRKPQMIGNKVGQFTVKETAKYELERGNWIFKQAGLKDVDRLNEITKVRVQAKTKATK